MPQLKTNLSPVSKTCLALALAGTVLSWPLAAIAQSNVSIRSRITDEYTRLVFEWPGSVAYDLIDNGKNLRLNFTQPGLLQQSAFNQNALSAISNLEILNTAGQNLSVGITLSEDYETRHFAVGSRIFIDLVGAGGPAPQSTSLENQSAPPASQPPLALTPPSRRPEAKPVETLSKDVEDLKKKTADQSADIVMDELKAPESLQDSVLPEGEAILLSSATPFRMASFIRGDTLWIVTNIADMRPGPSLAGQDSRDADALFKRVDIENGTAFYVPLSNVQARSLPKIRGEGGGIFWRIILGRQNSNTPPADPEENVKDQTLTWTLPEAGPVLKLDDPQTGDTLFVVPVSDSSSYAGPPIRFVELYALQSPVGLAIDPLIDDLEVKIKDDGQTVMVSRTEGGLSIADRGQLSQEKFTQQINALPSSQDGDDARIFNFEAWRMGHPKTFLDNQKLLLNTIVGKGEEGQLAGLMSLAQLNLANGRTYEALGLLRMAGQTIPDIAKTTLYRALDGAAHALAAREEEALNALLVRELNDFEEIKFWTAYAFAGLGDWQQAEDTLPEAGTGPLATYPWALRVPLALQLAETALRAGDVPHARDFLSLLDDPPKSDTEGYNVDAARAYLEGEAARQESDFEKALDLWDKAIASKDDQYKVKATLSKIMVQRNLNQMSLNDAIDKLESLRFGWRGDPLEAEVNRRLGKLYIDNMNFLKGFSILREAAGIAPKAPISQKITDEMAQIFEDLYLKGGVEDLPPMEAAMLYEEFTELTPSGTAGNKVVESLAERLVKADLLSRAADLLDHQVTHRLDEMESARTSLRLAAIRLLDNQPEKALPSLDKAIEIYRKIITDDTELANKEKEIRMLRARALSQLGRPDEALSELDILVPDNDIYKLQADIAWRAGRWDEAAQALDDLIIDEQIDPDQDLSKRQADLILNRGVALNLAGNRIGLLNLRNRYNPQMVNTQRANLFDVVTRPQVDSIVLADRDTLAALVAEVDLFREFLEAYRSAEPASIN